MKKISKKAKYLITLMSIAIMSFPSAAMAASTVASKPASTAASTTSIGIESDKVVNPVVDLINSFIDPVLALVGAGGALFCIFLGVKFAKADDPQEHEKAKKALKNAIIGFILIFVLMLALKISMPKFQDWVTNNN